MIQWNARDSRPSPEIKISGVRTNRGAICQRPVRRPVPTVVGTLPPHGKGGTLSLYQVVDYIFSFSERYCLEASRDGRHHPV